ncbi:MAG: hypothetical protein ABI442_19730 [Gemmatimonadaceae bacterium]
MPATPAKQLAGFIAKFEPSVAKVIRECRTVLRKRMPTATELVYDNYNFFVIGFCAAAKSSTCVVSIAAAANGIGLSFYYGATLPDPDKLLQGSGVQNRFIRLPSAKTLSAPGVAALIDAAVKQAKVPLPATGSGPLVIQSISAKQRPRRAAAKKRR